MIAEVIETLAKTAKRDSCFNCYYLKIKKGEIWCEKGMIERFNLLDKKEFNRNYKKIIKENKNCEYIATGIFE